MRRDLEKDVVGLRIKDGRGQALEERDARDPPSQDAEGLHLAARSAARSPRSSGGASTSCMHPRLRRRAGRALRHERPVPAGHRARVAMPPHTHVVLTFQQGGDLRYVDPRTFGEMFVTRGRRPRQGEGAPAPRDRPARPGVHLAHVPVPARRQGREDEAAPDGPEVHLAGSATSTPTRCCSTPGIRYDRMSDTLSSQEVRRLYRAIQEVLQEAIKLRGTTLEDEAYVDLFGKPGGVRPELKVYGRAGAAVPPVPDADREREDLAAKLVLLPAVPELIRRRSDELGAGVPHPGEGGRPSPGWSSTARTASVNTSTG